MLYEIINPSDAYTMISDDPSCAAVACLILGRGAYGLEDREGNNIWPILFGSDPDPMLKEKFGRDLDQIMNESRPGVIAALESVMIGSIGDCKITREAVVRMSRDDAVAWLRKRHDTMRTSTNDIRAAAQYYAKALRKNGSDSDAAT